MTVTRTLKPYEILFEQRPNYLFVSLSGSDINYEIAKQYWAEIINMQNIRHYSNVLIDKNFSQCLDAQDVFRIVTEVAFLARLGVKFAVIDPKFDPEKTDFEELVAGNRGMNIRHFPDIAGAEKWFQS